MAMKPKDKTTTNSKFELAALLTSSDDDYLKVHTKLGHPSKRKTIATAKKLGLKLKNVDAICENCQEGKA